MKTAMKPGKSFIGLIICLIFPLGRQPAFAQTNFWEQTNGPYGGAYVTSLAINPVTREIFAGTQDEGVFRSTDNGASWTALKLTGSVLSLAINTSGHVFAGTGGGIYRSTNNGDDWTALRTGMAVTCFAINPTTGHIFAGANSGIYGYGIFRSTNNGESWTVVNTGLLSWDVRCLAINPAIEQVFAGINGSRGGWGWGVYRSTNNGDSWSVVNSGLGSYFFTSLIINARGHIFVGTDGGVYRSFNNGDSWAAVNSGLTDHLVWSLAINPATGHIFAATDRRGVFRSVQSTTAVKDIAAEAPLSFELMQNYPNPFLLRGQGIFDNPSTTIHYELSQPVEVKLEIFDVLGRQVRTLVNQRQQAGRYSVIWDGRDEHGRLVAGGVYVYRLRGGGSVKTQKMVFVR